MRAAVVRLLMGPVLGVDRVWVGMRTVVVCVLTLVLDARAVGVMVFVAGADLLLQDGTTDALCCTGEVGSVTVSVAASDLV